MPLPFRARRVLFVAFVLGVAVRVAILANTRALGTKIVDEQHYSQIAQNIAGGNGFAWGPGEPTSIRPPLYPGLLAAVWTASPNNLQAIRVLQILLTFATAVLVYRLGSHVYDPTVAAWAAAATWLYPSLIFANFLILTETLFTFLLIGFVVLAVRLIQVPRLATAFACGTTLGLAALTRSILWPLPLVLCPLLTVLIRGPLTRRLLLPALVFAGYAVVVAPWAARNTRLQHVFTVVDTMGGINLRMGNYEYTPDDRMWDAVSLRGDQSWVHGLAADLPGPSVTEGEKEKWAQRKAIAYMRANPGITLRRAVIKFADFWGLEREFVAGVQSGFYTPPAWFQLIATAAIMLSYVALVTGAGAGIWIAAPRDWRVHAMMLLPVLLIMAGHTIVFGHSRYHLPLIPPLALYGSAAVVAVRRRVPRIVWSPAVAGAAVTVAVLMSVWVRQLVYTDFGRLASFFSRAG